MFGLSKDILEEIRAHLEARKGELLCEGDGKADPNRTDSLSVPDEDTQPYTEMNQVLTSRQNRLRAEELEKVEVALQRLENNPDEFGLCQTCEEAIKTGRLKVMPWARFCVPCKEEASDNKRGYRRRNTRDFIE